MKPRLTPPPLIEFMKWRVYVTYFFLHQVFENPNFNNDPWDDLEYRQVFAAFEPSLFGWFGIDHFYYDGSTQDSLTVFGITVGITHVVDFQSLSETPSAFIPPGAVPVRSIPEQPTPPTDSQYWVDTRSGALMIYKDGAWLPY